jgi:hypothetical protein
MLNVNLHAAFRKRKGKLAERLNATDLKSGEDVRASSISSNLILTFTLITLQRQYDQQIHNKPFLCEIQEIKYSSNLVALEKNMYGKKQQSTKILGKDLQETK